MLKRSNIVAAEEDLQAFYRELDAYSLAALWGQGGGAIEPKNKAVPFVWHWRDVRPQAMRAAELVGTEQAERRGLLLANPGLPFCAATNAAFHVVEGSGYSVVDGQRLDWEDKDVFCVPGWAFHEHVNTSDQPAILFSHTDVPVIRSLELYREEAHPAGRQ